ncbi:MAG: alkaline phosphatase family protein [Thermoplasmata archaeon]
MTDSTPPHRFDHMVVLMFENRSFDNLLGYLYQPGEVPAFEGLEGRNLSNPIPEYARDAEQGTVPVHPSLRMDTPDPDPGEEHPHTNTQLFGTVAPPENRFKPVEQMQPPFNAPGDPTTTPPMDGFVVDYINTFRVERGRLPRYEEYAQIMSCFRPDQMPVMSTLAKGFACFDHWFCEVPSQTFPNRSFFHAATSSGFVINRPVENFPLHNDAETIFERLEAAGLSWRVYFDPLQCVSITGMLHAARLGPYFATRFAPIDDFYRDAAAGTLPAYAFIEPSLIPPHSDMHPPGGARIRRLLFFLPRPSALKAGDALLGRVYNAVRASATEGGSNFSNTLLIVTFDEHGGTYDHVPPPKAPSPDSSAPAGQLGFRFDRSGVRIPTLAISAWIDAHTVVQSEYRSTSVIRTLRERWQLGPPLTQRDAVAADVAPTLSRTTPRPREDWPIVEAGPEPKPPGLWEELMRPLPTLGRHLFTAALAYEAHKTGTETSLDLSRTSRWRARRRMRKLTAAAFPKVTRRRGA